MTPEEHQMLVEIREATASNSRDLKMLKRSRRIANIMTAVYWLFIIGLSLGALYFLQPYVDTAKDAYSQILSI
ncbi:MAG: hypothetical protein Q8L64_05720 [bacterium]|nr:hypothetical protein [bacterium]